MSRTSPRAIVNINFHKNTEEQDLAALLERTTV